MRSGDPRSLALQWGSQDRRVHAQLDALLRRHVECGKVKRGAGDSQWGGSQLPECLALDLRTAALYPCL